MPEEGPPTSPDAAGYLSDLAEKLAAHTGRVPAAELALDLVLHEIVEQARLATNASGAAIALVRERELVCRATTGPNAPDLGVRLTVHSGLSAACVRTLQPQCCDDIQIDSRVDAATQQQGVRSVLIVPLMDGNTLAGIFAVFSERTHAFADRDVQTLRAFSARIVESIRGASEATMRAATSVAPRRIPFIDTPTSELEPIEKHEPGDAPAPAHDYWADVMSALIVGLALLLGWMIGRAGWQRAFTTPAPPAAPPAASQSPQEASEPHPALAAGPPVTAKSGQKTQSRENPPAGGMVVYQDGKVVFAMPPAAPGKRAESAPSGQTAPSALVIPPEVAEALLIHRVEPLYPVQAKQAGVQGKVVLEATIGRDGAVQKLIPVSGDPGLSAAATDAVRQWRYKPYLHNGQPLTVQTRIELQFALP